MPSPSRALASTVVALVTSAITLGLLPPAVGRAEVPPTVVRTVELDAGRLAPSRAALAPGGGLAVERATWSAPARVCSPIRFTMMGFVWQQQGAAVVRARLGWSGGERPGHRRVVADPDEGPDPGSPEDAGLAGTPPLWTGEARCARVALRLPAGERIEGVRAVFVNTSGTATEPSFLDRAGDLLASAWGMLTSPPASETAGATTTQPAIITRAGWGANEKLRRCGPSYADSVEMAYVHHTVNGNGYSRARADDLIRGIYAYHTRGRKYCDIAYNFLIDRFGRIYEGRYGGMDLPVIGAHAMGFNTGSTGVAALGDFTGRKPPRRVINAYRALLSWRLDVAHVRPTGTARMESAGGSNTRFDKGDMVTLPAVSGHRDTGYTSCPGARLYKRLAAIRRGAELRGLPKIWDHEATPNPSYPGQTVQITAVLSQSMPWEVEISALADGAVVREFSGSGSNVSVPWDRKDATGLSEVPPGEYVATISAGDAREASLSLTLL